MVAGAFERVSRLAQNRPSRLFGPNQNEYNSITFGRFLGMLKCAMVNVPYSRYTTCD